MSHGGASHFLLLLLLRNKDFIVYERSEKKRFYAYADMNNDRLLIVCMVLNGEILISVSRIFDPLISVSK